MTNEADETAIESLHRQIREISEEDWQKMKKSADIKYERRPGDPPSGWLADFVNNEMPRRSTTFEENLQNERLTPQQLGTPRKG